MLPLMAKLPGFSGTGDDPFGVVRDGHAISYQPFPEPARHAWRNPRIEEHLTDYRLTGANLAANVFDILRQAPYRDRIAQSPHPRLRTLLASLDGFPSVVDDGKYKFSDAVTGTRLSLADVPEPPAAGIARATRRGRLWRRRSTPAR